MSNGGLMAGAINPAQANILGAMDKGRERQANDMAGELLGQTIGGKIGDLARLSPDKALKFAEATGIPTTSMGRIKNLMGVNIMGAKLLQSGQTQEAAQFLDEEATKIETLTNQPATNLRRMVRAIQYGNQEAVDNFIKAGRSMDPTAPKPKYSQATNKDMRGWAFDESTGTYSLDPNYSDFLATDAGRLAGMDMLGAKDVVGVNDKVTTLIKDSVGINKAANDLVALETSGTTSDQIAAVFKFMKAMDPTSTVRESELGMVYSAEGAAQGFANYVNSLIQGKKIDAEGFKKIVNTAKTLSNSAAEASTGEVDKYTNVFSDNITPKQLNAIKERVPGMFEITPIASTPTPTNAQGWKLMEDAGGNKAYVGPNGEIEEVN
jgi:hypothetical protein